MRQASTFERIRRNSIGNPPSPTSTLGALLSMLLSRLYRLGKAISHPQNRQLILAISLLAFEMFNFFVSRFAMTSFLGETSFVGVRWATILALAFCAIDFSGLIYLFGPERIRGGRKEAWYLMATWLIGATMGALMTWWAVALILSDRESGIAFLNRSEMLRYIPMVIALAVWMIRLIFIRMLSSVGDQFSRPTGVHLATKTKPPAVPSRRKPRPAVAFHGSKLNELPLTTSELPAFLLGDWPRIEPKWERKRTRNSGPIIFS